MDIARPPSSTPAPIQGPVICNQCGGTPERRKRVRIKIGMIDRLGPCGASMHFKRKTPK